MSKKGIKRTKKFDLGNSLYSKKISLRILRLFESKFAIFRCDPVAALDRPHPSTFREKDDKELHGRGGASFTRRRLHVQKVKDVSS